MLTHARELIVLDAVDDVGDIAETNRRAIFVSDDDRLIGVGGKNLIVRSNGERLSRSVEAAFRRVDVRLAEDGAHIFETQSERRDRRRIHLHAHGRLLISLES